MIRKNFTKTFKLCISRSYLIKIIRKFGITRKRKIRFNLRKNSEKVIEQRHDFAIKFQKILSSDIKILLLDESGFNLQNNINYGYSRRGELCYSSCPDKGKNLSLISAIDKEGVVCSMFVDGGTKSPDVVFFIYKLKEILKKKGFNIDDYLII